MLFCLSSFTVALAALLHSAAAITWGDPAKTNWADECATTTMCILTGPGINVTANFEDGAINRGVLKGTGLTVWEVASNGPEGTIVGCGGSATWEFQEMGSAFYDSTGSNASGRLYAWFRSDGVKTMRGALRSDVVGDDLFTMCQPPALEE